MTPQAAYKARQRAKRRAGEIVVTPDVRPRFMSKVQVCPDTGCWIWQGPLAHGGYGEFSIQGAKFLAHRVAFELFVRALLPGEHIDHKCDTPACTNPSDLEPVTPAENNRRKGLTMSHCKRGHERTPENIYVTPTGLKQCRPCRKRGDSHYAE